MNRRLPPGLKQRQYKTKGSYKRILYYPTFTCWDRKRRQFAPGIEDFQTAKTRLAELRIQNAQQHDFDKPPAPAETLSSWAAKWLELKTRKKTAPKDVLSVKRLKDYFGNPPLEKILTSKMEGYKNCRLLAGAAVATINREFACLRSILLFAFHDGALRQMPRIPFETEYNERDRLASPKEYKAIIGKLTGRARLAVELLYELGFRIGELCAVEARDLDLREDAIDTARFRTKKGLRVRLPLPPRASAIFREMVRTAVPGKPLVGLDRWQISDKFRAACKDLNITGLWIHDLRATFATRKIGQGWDRKLVQLYTGHRSAGVFDRYLRPTTDDLRRFIGGRAARWGHGGDRKAQGSRR